MNCDARMLTALTAGLLLSAPALAQDESAPPAPEVPVGVEESFDPDYKPDAPEVDVPDPFTGIRSYAGVGSPWAYATAGVGEIGGSVAFSTSFDATTFAADPQIGYFLWDNIQLKAILSIRHLSVQGESANRFGAMLEPSAHLPINDGLFWFGGIGAGVALADHVGPGVVTGLEIAPRTGLQVLVGRSGLLNLGVRYSALLSGVQTDFSLPQGQAILAFVNTLDLQAGYTVMF